LLTIGSSSFQYDAAGNMTYDPSNTAAHIYQWDAEGRVSKVDPANNPPTWIFTYNALGHRVQFASPTMTEQHVFDPDGNWLGLANSSTFTLVRLGGRHLIVDTPTETYFHHVNVLGSTSMMTDHLGNPIEDLVFYPWGDAWQGAGNGGYGFATTQYYDVVTITALTPARVLGVNFGRWFSPDPIGKKAVGLDDPQTWNMYAYVRNNPTTDVDPTGEACVLGITIFGSWFGGSCHTDPPPGPPMPPPSPLQTDQTARTALMAPTRPSGRTETVYQIGGIVNAETQGMKDSKAENVPLLKAREEIAAVRINGDQAYGDKVETLAGMQPPLYSGPDFQASLNAAANAAWDNLNGISLTGGATNMNMRPTTDTSPFLGMPIYTTAGPYLSPNPNTVINTYGPNID
jgi:RHS repeat-associated protein